LKVDFPGRIPDDVINEKSCGRKEPEPENKLGMKQTRIFIDQGAHAHAQAQSQPQAFQARHLKADQPQQRPAGKVNDDQKAEQEFTEIGRRNVELEEDEKEKDEAQEKEGEKNDGAERARLKRSPLFFHLSHPEDIAHKEKKCQSDEQGISAFLTAIAAERYTFGRG
jgi:hypothetical protein